MNNHSGSSLAALQKGFDIVELLSQIDAPISLTQIAVRLDRSVTQIFRIVHVLARRGYVERCSHDGYRLTGDLFSLAVGRPSISHIITLATPLMRELRKATGHTNYLSLRWQRHAIAIACENSVLDHSVNISVGFKQDTIKSAPGLVILSFEKHRPPTSLRGFPCATDVKPSHVKRQCAEIRLRGYAEIPDSHLRDVTHISFPLYVFAGQCAALTVPFLKRVGAADVETCRAQLQQTAFQLNTLLRSETSAPSTDTITEGLQYVKAR